MRIVMIMLSTSLLLASARDRPDPVHSLAGRYSWHFRNGDIAGNSYWSDDVVEIVPVDARHAFVRFNLQFFNGHECGLSGIAEAQGNSLLYRDLPGDREGIRGQCTLPISRRGNKLTWNDADGGCQMYCGARGSFGNGSIAWSSKRPITYMARLKASKEDRDALTEWRTGKPVDR